MHANPETGPAPDAAPPEERRIRRRAGRPTKRQAEARDAELLDKALDLFLEKGFEGATIRDITQAIGMAKRTVASRHGSKVALFKAALKRAIDDWVVPEEQLRAAETDDLEETLLRIARILANSFLSPASLKLLRIANAESFRMPEISAYTYEQCTRPQIAYLADLFRRRADGGDFPDAERYALSFLTLLGTPMRMVAWGVPLSEAEIAAGLEHSVRLFLHGLPHRGAASAAGQAPLSSPP